MTSKKAKNRMTRKIIVAGRIHTIIEQDPQRNGIYDGAYQGNKGFVLKKVETLNDSRYATMES